MNNDITDEQKIKAFCEILPKFKLNQIDMIMRGLKAKVDVSLYADPKFSVEQMEVISRGLYHCFDATHIKLFAIESLFIYEMEYISNEIYDYGRMDKEINIFDSMFQGSDFDPCQKINILIGLKLGLDVSLYADKKYHWREMHQLRKCLEYKSDIKILKDNDYEFDQMEIIVEGLKRGLNVSAYLNKRFDAYQMNEILEGLISGVDVSIYADLKFDHQQMTEIREGLKENLDPAIFARAEFPFNLIRAICAALKGNKNIRI